MPARIPSHEIDWTAAEWAAREDLRPLDPVEEEQLDAWLAADQRHLGAYGKAKAVLVRADAIRQRAADAGEIGACIAEPVRHDPMPAWVPVTSRRRMIGALAASLVAVGGGGWLLRRSPAAEQIYTTLHGEIRVLPLEDGSIVTLNTASRLAVAFDANERRVRLEDGEAYFQVAKDAERPFRVESEGRTVQAVGTAFSVRRGGDGLNVLVREGRVRFERPGGAREESVSLFVDGETEIVDRTSGAAPLVLHRAGAEMDRTLAWLDAKIAFNETSLADAALEFRRYSGTPIMIAPAVKAMRISGRYPATDPEGFARAVAEILDLRVVRTQQGINLTSKDNV